MGHRCYKRDFQYNHCTKHMVHTIQQLYIRAKMYNDIEISLCMHCKWSQITSCMKNISYFLDWSETHTGKALLCVYILLVRSILTSKRRRNSYLRSSSLHYIEYVFTKGSYSYYTAHCSPQSFSTIVYNGASFYFLYCVCVDGRDVFYFWHTWYRYTTLFYKGRQKILRQKCTKTICYCYYHCPKYIFALFKNTISIMGNATVHFIRYAHEWKDYFIGLCLLFMPLLNTSQLDTSAFEAVSNIFTCHKGI